MTKEKIVLAPIDAIEHFEQIAAEVMFRIIDLLSGETLLPDRTPH